MLNNQFICPTLSTQSKQPLLVRPVLQGQGEGGSNSTPNEPEVNSQPSDTHLEPATPITNASFQEFEKRMMKMMESAMASMGKKRLWNKAVNSMESEDSEDDSEETTGVSCAFVKRGLSILSEGVCQKTLVRKR